MQSTTIIAFDQHAATTVAAVLLPGHRTSALHTLTSENTTILRFVERVRRERPVRCCYEAGPCGFELQRALKARDISCDVIAPALIPRRAGDRVKTDRRDADHLAILYRAGALTAIHIPTNQEEAARDLLRCREDIRADLLRARHRLSKFLLRHGRRFTATKKAWSKRHDTWLRQQVWAIPALDQTHRAYVRAVDEAVARLRAVEQDLRALLTLEPLRPRVERLRCSAASTTSPHSRSRRNSAMRAGLQPRRAQWRSWASSRRSIRAGRNTRAAASPKPVMPISGAFSSKPRGTIGIIHSSAVPSASASAAPPRPSSPARGGRSTDSIVAIVAWRRVANPNSTS
jgi:hypothetical protein